MTYEEMERTMQFILEQQAQFTANFQKMEEAREKDSARTTHLEESFRLLVRLVESHDDRLVSLAEAQISLTETQISLTETQNSLAETQNSLAETQNSLVEAQSSLVVAQSSLAETQSSLAEAQARTDKQLRETDEQMKETDERLNSLIAVVERYITSRGQNGSS